MTYFNFFLRYFQVLRLKWYCTSTSVILTVKVDAGREDYPRREDRQQIELDEASDIERYCWLPYWFILDFHWSTVLNTLNESYLPYATTVPYLIPYHLSLLSLSLSSYHLIDYLIIRMMSSSSNLQIYRLICRRTVDGACDPYLHPGLPYLPLKYDLHPPTSSSCSSSSVRRELASFD